MMTPTIKIGDIWETGKVKRRVLILFKIRKENFVGYLFETPCGMRGCVDSKVEDFLEESTLVFRGTETQDKKG